MVAILAVVGGAALVAAGALPARTEQAVLPAPVSPQEAEEDPTSTPTSVLKGAAAAPIQIVSESLPQAESEGERESEAKSAPKEPVGPEFKAREGVGEASESATITSSAEEEVAAQGSVYTWHDGDREMRAVLQNDVPLSNDSGPVVAGSATAENGQDGSEDGGGYDNTVLPVFKSESGGGEMTLPGGVILLLDESWDEAGVERFFAKNGINFSRLTEIEFLDNAYLIETEAGFPALELANGLAVQDGVVSSSPNWRRENVGK